VSASPSGGDGWLFRAAVLALGGGRREVAGQAGRAGLDGRRIAEHDLAAPRLDVLVGRDNQELHHRDKDDEIDDRGNERAEIQESLRIAGLPELYAQAH